MRRAQPLGLVGSTEKFASFVFFDVYSAPVKRGGKSSPSTLELQRPVVFPEGPQIGFEKPESSLCIDRVNAGRSKAHCSTLLFPYNLLRVFYVTRRFGEIINFTAHYGSPVYKAPPQLCLALN